MPALVAPVKFLSQRDLLTCFATVRAKIAVNGDLPRRGPVIIGRVIQSFIILLGEVEHSVVVSLLQAAQIGKGLRHGCDAQLVPQDIEHGQLRRDGLIFRYKLLELLFIPHMSLLDGRHTPTGQQQTQKLIEAIGNRKDILADLIGGIDGKDHLALSPDCAVVDAVHTGPADNAGADRSTEVFVAVTGLLELDGGKVNFQLLEFLVGSHRWPPWGTDSRAMLSSNCISSQWIVR